MDISTQDRLLPGFEDAVHHAQQTFRTLLAALAEPGTVGSLTLELETPPGLTLTAGATSLALLDLETQVWLGSSDPSQLPDLRRWLQFHTGCRFTQAPQNADFALVLDSAALAPLSHFCPGLPEEPERSTTLILQIPSLEGGETALLSGPGIPTQRPVTPAVPKGFWSDWRQNHRRYPLGVDAYFACGSQIMGLPRSTHCAGENAPCPT